MATVTQEQAELIQQQARELANQIAEAFGVESIAVESTAKGIRLKTLRVHRDPDEPWSEVITRTVQIVEALEQQFGALS